MSIWKYLGLVVVLLYVVGFFLSLGGKFMKKQEKPPSKSVVVAPRNDAEN